MKKASKILSVLLALTVAFSVPLSAAATTTTSTIFFSSTKYVHQTKLDGLDIIEGIDVSKHNGDIDFKKVKAAGVKFVIMRIGYRGYGSSGSVSKDIKFESYIKAAHDAGLDIGVYFYSQALNETEAKEEANFVINNLKSYKSYVTLPVAFDYEFADVQSGRLDAAWSNKKINKTKMTANAIAFCNTIEAAGYDAMVYANKSFLTDNLDHEKLEQLYDIWLAHYIKNTNYTGDYRFWQFSEKGTINGISGNVDCDFMYSGLNVSDIAAQLHTGKALTPSVKVTTYAGKTLTKGTDYTIQYKNNTALGVASYTVTGTGSYAKYPKVTKYFDIKPNVITGLKTTAVKAESLTVSWDKYTGATGYQVWIKKPSGWINLGLTSATSYTFKDLEPTTEYEISIRAYVTVDSRKIYGKYGEYLKATTKVLAPEVTSNTNGWIEFRDNWYYYKSGIAQTGWQTIGGIQYYFDSKGVMQTGWLDYSGKKYYFLSSGKMAVKWLKIDGIWYYFADNGAMCTEWITVSGKRY